MLMFRFPKNWTRSDAQYTGGVLKPRSPLPFPEGAEVELAVRRSSGDRPLKRNPEWVLFACTVALYLFTRFWSLSDFPIYFFCDEALQALQAERLVAENFRDAKGVPFPVFFELAPQRWGPLFAAYVHVPTVVVFGKKVFYTRATCVIMSLFGAVAVGLILKLAFAARWWWSGTLLLAMFPAWFLHSRTAFQSVVATAFYAGFLLGYLLYRTVSPRYLYATVCLGAAAFYSYSNTQTVVASTVSLLLFSDLSYHRQNWRVMVRGLLLGALLAIPAVVFYSSESHYATEHLRAIGSYWVADKTLGSKLSELFLTYVRGLSPLYWFFPNDYDLARHRMQGYGHLNTAVLPLVLAGLAGCIWRIRSPQHRVVLAAALSAPFAGVMLDVAITRVLAFIVPAGLLAALGVEAAGRCLERRSSTNLVSLGIFIALAAPSLLMLRDSVTNGPLWYRDYGLYGMQYGARQIFEEAVPAYLKKDPQARLFVSPAWANGTEWFLPYFLSPQQRGRVQLLNVDYLLARRRTIDPNALFVMTQPEYRKAASSPKLKAPMVEKVLPYPDGTPGFYFARVAYSERADAIFDQEKKESRVLVNDQIQLDGEPITVAHSRFDMGGLKDLFDKDPRSLARGSDANPLVIEFLFPRPRRISTLRATLGTMDFSLSVALYRVGSPEPAIYRHTYHGLPPDPTVEIPFASPPDLCGRIRVEILQENASEEVHIHVRELSLR